MDSYRFSLLSIHIKWLLLEPYYQWLCWFNNNVCLHYSQRGRLTVRAFVKPKISACVNSNFGGSRNEWVRGVIGVCHFCPFHSCLHKMAAICSLLFPQMRVSCLIDLDPGHSLTLPRTALPTNQGVSRPLPGKAWQWWIHRSLIDAQPLGRQCFSVPPLGAHGRLPPAGRSRNLLVRPDL